MRIANWLGLLINKLEDLDLVQRTAHPTDRRVFLLEMTSHCERAMWEAKRLLVAFEEELLAPLSTVEARGFREAMYRVWQRTGTRRAQRVRLGRDEASAMKQHKTVMLSVCTALVIFATCACAPPQPVELPPASELARRRR